MIKVICTVGDGNFIEGKIYEAEIINFWISKKCIRDFTIDGSIPINANFIPLTEYREQQMKSILDD